MRANPYPVLTRYYLVSVGLALPISMAFRVFVATELGADDYLFSLLNVTGICFSVLIATRVAGWSPWLYRKAPADGGACGG